MAFRFGPKRQKQLAIVVVFLALTLTFIPVVTLAYLACGLLDVLRNEKRDYYLFQRYFSGNGFTTWLVSPVNLLIDLISYRNRKIFKLEDFPDDARRETEDVLQVFQDGREEIMARIDRDLDGAKRGMMIYR